jgi:hypothetical protein
MPEVAAETASAINRTPWASSRCSKAWLVASVTAVVLVQEQAQQ